MAGTEGVDVVEVFPAPPDVAAMTARRVAWGSAGRVLDPPQVLTVHLGDSIVPLVEPSSPGWPWLRLGRCPLR